MEVPLIEKVPVIETKVVEVDKIVNYLTEVPVEVRRDVPIYLHTTSEVPKELKTTIEKIVAVCNVE